MCGVGVLFKIFSQRKVIKNSRKVIDFFNDKALTVFADPAIGKNLIFLITGTFCFQLNAVFIIQNKSFCRCAFDLPLLSGIECTELNVLHVLMECVCTGFGVILFCFFKMLIQSEQLVGSMFDKQVTDFRNSLAGIDSYFLLPCDVTSIQRIIDEMEGITKIKVAMDLLPEYRKRTPVLWQKGVMKIHYSIYRSFINVSIYFLPDTSCQCLVTGF